MVGHKIMFQNANFSAKYFLSKRFKHWKTKNKTKNKLKYHTGRIFIYQQIEKVVFAAYLYTMTK
jgi:hypothetical protein